ncbi:CIA30 family protein [Halorhodospira halophila]|uniref:CIA30 family protein n=1 Tax=Halorhodospira halophila TaxID=1053 RepID=UPI001913675A|nr:CIA30 family protein [Halorhodospira halophila]MBK5936830.1 hypothetical protein [Halorhodospira halophila]
MSGTESPAAYLLDDFTAADGRAAIGTAWQGFTDRVMGGRSDMHAGIVETDRGPALRLSGQVRLENNGGFIQSRLPLAPSGERFDASAWAGFGVTVRGTPGPYYLHVRSADTRQPWQHYRAPLEVAEDWQEVVVPFTAFEPRGLQAALDPARLTSVAVVAYGEAFEARVEVARLELSAAHP